MTSNSQFFQNQMNGPYGSSYQVDRSYQNNAFNTSKVGLKPTEEEQFAKPYEEEQYNSLEPQSRVSYLRRLYLAVFFQVLTTSIFTYYTENSIAFRAWIVDTSGLTFIFSLIVTILLGFAAFLQKSKLSRPVINYISYILYTLSFATLFSYLDARYSPNIHYSFLILTYLFAGLFLHALLCFGFITFQNAAIFIVGSVLIVMLKLEIFSSIGLQTIYILSTFAILLGFYIVWENETVISGAKTEWSREDPIVGSIGFFLNLFTLFLRLAHLISRLTITQYTRQ